MVVTFPVLSEFVSNRRIKNDANAPAYQVFDMPIDQFGRIANTLAGNALHALCI